MLEGVALEPGDRVLFLTIPEFVILARFSEQTPRGIVVALGTRDEVYEARAAVASHENVMIVPASLDEIPWRDAFFSWVIETRGGWTLDRACAREVVRVLIPEGHAWISGVDTGPLVEAGLLNAGSGAGYRLLRKAAEAPPVPANGLFKVL